MVADSSTVSILGIDQLSEQITDQEAAINSIRSIFFESSVRKKFSDQQERDRFYQKWTDIYLSDYREQVFVATIADEVVGYLMGCHQSLERLSDFTERVPSYSLFEDHFVDYPAHLHINLAATARGHGVGSQLIDHYKQWLKRNQIEGLHLVTSPEARNVSFYRKNRFVFEDIRELSGHQFLFMGQKI